VTVDTVVESLVRKGLSTGGYATFITGAGISAESGIPTYRGSGGTWTTGGIEEMNKATYAWFVRNPEAAWERELQRLRDFGSSQPNAAHEAIARLHGELDDFMLVTQNIDGLHRMAGHEGDRYIEIHGALRSMRCRDGCSGIFPIPEDAVASASGPPCPDCGGSTRPHILWFDEYYDEENFRFHSSLEAAASAQILVVVGTSGATNLPMQVGQLCLGRGAAIVDINPDANPFSLMAERAERGFFLQGSSGQFLPPIAELLGG